MKKLNFTEYLVLPVLLVLGSCSDESKRIYSESEFRGRKFTSDVYQGTLRAELQFSGDANEVKAKNLPEGGNLSMVYEVLPGDRSPSGRATISLKSQYYFIIVNENTLLYSYYDGPVDKKLKFKEN